MPGASHESPPRFVDDVFTLRTLEGTDIVTAGFPCQDLSQAGRMAGITGARSGVVSRVLDLLDALDDRPTLVLENVPFMLQLDGGRAMSYLVDRLQSMGYAWAYRVVDAQAFGLPQRRQRVLMLASTTFEPQLWLMADEAEPIVRDDTHVAGFYWTEGNRGLGWAPDAVPPLKGGSGLGIASPPAFAIRGEGIFTPTIEAAERLQGFEAGWTEPVISAGFSERCRWQLVGNAVAVPMAYWLASRLRYPGEQLACRTVRLDSSKPSWPRAAFGSSAGSWTALASNWPVSSKPLSLLEVIGEDRMPLSRRATHGFLSRLRRSRLRRPEWFDRELERHLARADRDAATDA